MRSSLEVQEELPYQILPPRVWPESTGPTHTELHLRGRGGDSARAPPSEIQPQGESSPRGTNVSFGEGPMCLVSCYCSQADGGEMGALVSVDLHSPAPEWPIP